MGIISKCSIISLVLIGLTSEVFMFGGEVLRELLSIPSESYVPI